METAVLLLSALSLVVAATNKGAYDYNRPVLPHKVHVTSNTEKTPSVSNTFPPNPVLPLSVHVISNSKKQSNSFPQHFPVQFVSDVISNSVKQFNVSNSNPPNVQGKPNILCGREGYPACNQGKEKEFYLQNIKVNWFQANELCRSNSMRLATISDEAENNKLKAMLNKYTSPPKNVWLSGSDLALEGSFTWMSTGQPLTFTDWDQAHETPNNKDGNQHCVSMNIWYPSSKYTWNDNDCKQKFNFVCENY